MARRDLVTTDSVCREILALVTNTMIQIRMEPRRTVLNTRQATLRQAKPARSITLPYRVLYVKLFEGPYCMSQVRDRRGRLLLTTSEMSDVFLGSTKCPSGWSREYYGYVMANYYTHNKGEYVCVDVDMEKGDGGSNNNQDRLVLLHYYIRSLTETTVC